MEDDTEHERTIDALGRLAAELEARSLLARVVPGRSGPPFLRVINPRATSLAENVTCRSLEPGGFQGYFWSWGEPVHTVDDATEAANKIARVLAAVGDQVPAI